MRVGGIRHPICRTKSVVKLYERCYSGIIQHGHDTHNTHTAHALEGARSAGRTRTHVHVHTYTYVHYVNSSGIRQNVL